MNTRTSPPHRSGSLLPAKFAVVIRHDVRRFKFPLVGEQLLLGGSPLRVIRLSTRASELLEGDLLTVRDQVGSVLARRLLDANAADPVLGPPPESCELTVVVPVRDRPEQLERCLAGLAGLDVIVVDDASRDPKAVADVVRRHGALLLVLRANLGPAGARNAGLARVTTPYVAFVDSDVEVTPATLLGLASHLSDPLVALVGPLVRGITRSLRPRWFERYDAAASSLALGRQSCSVQIGARVAWLPSACLVARTVSLKYEDIGGFAADMRVGEDVDLVWRLVRAGWKVRYDPEFIACHDVRASLGAWLGRKVVYGSGGAPLSKRHGDAVAVARLSPLMASAAALVLLRRRWSLAAAGAATVWSARTVHRSLPEMERRVRVAAGLAIKGLGWSVVQEWVCCTNR